MPCSTRKARLLLKEKKAKIVIYNPFTIQLLYATGEATQEINLGVDVGSKHIGIAITTENKVLAKGEIELRQDVSKLIETRKMLRNGRRSRKTRYRKPRFLNRTSSKKDGWLPPSIQSRINNTVRWIIKFFNLLPNPKLTIEVGKFDIQKIENPETSGVNYQQGDMYGYRNKIAYLLAREFGKCQLCGEPYIKGDGWRLHHIWGKSKDRSIDWALLHESCHIKLHHDGLEQVLRTKKSKSYKEATFMNIIRRRLFTAFPYAKFTYGNITFQDRCSLNLEKTHYNDAIAITGIKTIKQNDNSIFLMKQFRKKKRSLHEVNAVKGRTSKNTNQVRHKKNTKCSRGYFLNDKVEVFGKVGFISGFTGKYRCYIKDIYGIAISYPENVNKQIGFNKLKLISHNNNWQCAFSIK